MTMKSSSVILNGCAAGSGRPGLAKDKAARILAASEIHQTNSWNVNPQSGQLNNNNNKYNGNVVRPALALDDGSLAGWMEAYAECIGNKMKSGQCVSYRLHDTDLLELIEECEERRYEPSRSTAFVVTRPKLREVFAASFRDRIVQHWICRRIEPLFEKRFAAQGNVSWNCRKGCGTRRAVDALRRDILDVSDGYRREAWIGRFDIRSFFMSINIRILERLAVGFVEKYYTGSDKDLLVYLLAKTIRHRPQDNCVRQGDIRLWRRLPRHKSLFLAERHKGMPIGNITSQLLANFYLSFLDGYITEECRQEGARYERFVDDFAVVCRTKGDVLRLRDKASAFLKDRLDMEMHRDKVYIQEARKGVRFVGSVIKMERIYTGNRTVGGLVRRLMELDAWLEYLGESFTLKDAYRLAGFASSINSYFGFTAGHAAYALKRRLVNDYCPNFFTYLYMTGRCRSVGVRRQYRIEQYLNNI